MSKKSKIMQAVQAAIGDAGTYVNWVSQLGTARDKASGGSFASSTVSDEQIEAVYRDWIAERIINKPASDMLRAGWFYEGVNDKELSVLSEEMKRLNLMEVLQSVLVLSRLHGIAYVLLGVADNLTLDQELGAIGQGRLEYFTVIKKSQAKAQKEYLSLNESRGELKQSKFYEVDLDGKKTKVHHSRLIAFKNNKVLNQEPESVLQSVYHEILRHASVKASAASLVHEAKIDVIKTPRLIDKLKEDMAGVTARFSAVGLMKSINGMLVLDKEESLESKTYNFSGLPDLMREYSVQTAGAADIPYTILFGQSPAGMNATGEHDTRNYYDSINTKQEWTLRPRLMQLLGFICLSAFGRVIPGLNIVFNPLWQLDAKTRAEVEKANAERDEKYLGMRVITEAQLAKQLVIDGVYSVIDTNHIQLLDALSEAGPNE